MEVWKPGTTAWVGDQGIELTEGETLGGLWVSTAGGWDGIEIVEPPIPLNGDQPVQAPWQNATPRVGILWADAELTIVDPLSTLADVLWTDLLQVQWSCMLLQWPNALAQEVVESVPKALGSIYSPATKVEGQRRVESGSKWIIFTGSDSARRAGQQNTFSDFGWVTALVSALVILPGEE